MKISKIITAVLCSAIMVTSSFSTANAVDIKPEGLTIIGDSIASGYGLDGYVSGDNYSADNYGKFLCDEYGISSENYYNYAVDGETTMGLLAKLETGQYDEGIENSDVIIVSIGGNDLLDAIIGKNSAVFKDTELDAFLNGEINIAELLKDIDLKTLAAQLTSDAQEKLEIFYQNMPKIAKYVTDKNPDALVILQTLYNPMNSGVEIIDNLYGQTISSLNFGIDGMDGCVIADVNSAFANCDRKLIQKDFTHPNADGHKVIFETVKDVIDTYFTFSTEPVIPDNPVATQPVETTTTTATTTTVIETTTTAPATTTTVVTTVPDVTTTIVENDDENENNSKLATVVVPIVMIAVGIVIIFGIVSINKNRKN